MTTQVTDKPTVYVSQTVFDKLMDYSCSIPTGTTASRWWKSKRTDGWMLGCYAASDKEGYINIY